MLVFIIGILSLTIGLQDQPGKNLDSIQLIKIYFSYSLEIQVCKVHLSCPIGRLRYSLRNVNVSVGEHTVNK